MSLLKSMEVDWTPEQRFLLLLTIAERPDFVAGVYYELWAANCSLKDVKKWEPETRYRFLLAVAEKAAQASDAYSPLSSCLKGNDWKWDLGLSDEENLVSLVKHHKTTRDMAWKERYELLFRLVKRPDGSNNALAEKMAKVERVDETSAQQYQLLLTWTDYNGELHGFFERVYKIRDDTKVDFFYENFFPVGKDLPARLRHAEPYLEHEDPQVRDWAVWALGDMDLRLAEVNRTDLALKVMARLADTDPGVRLRAQWAWRRMLSQISDEELAACCLKGTQYLVDENFHMELASDDDIVRSITSSLSEKAQLTLALKVAEYLAHHDAEVRERAIAVLPGLVDFPAKYYLRLVLKEAEYLTNEDPNVRSSVINALGSSVSYLDIDGRLGVLKALTRQAGLEGLNLEAATMVLEGVSGELLSAYAEAGENVQLRVLADYHASGLPFDGYFWLPYVQSADRPAYLRETSSEVVPYRRGQVLSNFDERQLHLAYAGLDSPEGLSFQEFSIQLKRDPPPPPFLPQPFHARVLEISSVHGHVDKGMLMAALKPIREVRDTEAFKRYLTAHFREEMRSLRRVKGAFEVAFPNGWEELDEAGVLAAAKQLLPSIWERRAIPAVANLITSLTLLLASHKPGSGGLLHRMEGVFEEHVSSEGLVDGLRAGEEFYRDTVEDVAREFQLNSGQMPFLRRQRSHLQTALARLKQELGQEVDVEFIPSASQTDRAFGHVAEDCNKDSDRQMDVIYRADFQRNRMISRGRLVGMHYLQKGELGGKRVLVTGIQPRSRWKVDPMSLLLAIEHELARVAAMRGDDLVLLMKDTHQQSNRSDMLDAIKRRNYPAVNSKHEISGAVFEGNDFLVMWERTPSS
jgi:hypothetical protein